MEIIYLTLEQILLIHEDQLVRYGGSPGLRDLILLESAVFRPQSSFDGEDLYATIFYKAASLMISFILNHAFLDGNKRTGIASMLVFLELNGYKLKISQKALVNTALGVESKKINIKKLAALLKKHSKRIR